MDHQTLNEFFDEKDSDNLFNGANQMHPKTCRLCLSIIPALFAFFLASVFAIVL